jgi:hypothetical protein
MLKRLSILLMSIMLCIAAFPQSNTRDTAINPITDFSAIDTTIDYDELFRDFDSFMDSILSPRNYFLASVSVVRGYYNFTNKNNFSIDAAKRLTYSPTLGYYHKSGVGITGNGYITNDGTNMNLYQVAISPSYDYLQNRDLATGISFTRFFTRDSLPFYTTPLLNELSAYFTYRKWWIKPMISINYGWGSRTDYSERETIIQDLRLRRRGFTYVNTEETVSDFSIVASVRHDFYWLDVFSGRDHIRFTPQLAFTSGTQKFGFNQSSGTYVTNLRTTNNVLYNSENVYLDDELKFQPLSLSMYLRGEYSVGKFFVQPQLTFDYYFPASTNNFNTVFSFTAGFIF